MDEASERVAVGPEGAPRHRRPRMLLGAPIDLRATMWAVGAVIVVVIGVFLGSGGLQWFDAALAGYLIGVLLAVFATVYRYLIWLQRPPTARLNQRGWELFRSRGMVRR